MTQVVLVIAFIVIFASGFSLGHYFGWRRCWRAAGGLSKRESQRLLDSLGENESDGEEGRG